MAALGCSLYGRPTGTQGDRHDEHHPNAHRFGDPLGLARSGLDVRPGHRCRRGGVAAGHPSGARRRRPPGGDCTVRGHRLAVRRRTASGGHGAAAPRSVLREARRPPGRSDVRAGRTRLRGPGRAGRGRPGAARGARGQVNAIVPRHDGAGGDAERNRGPADYGSVLRRQPEWSALRLHRVGHRRPGNEEPGHGREPPFLRKRLEHRMVRDAGPLTRRGARGVCPLSANRGQHTDRGRLGRRGTPRNGLRLRRDHQRLHSPVESRWGGPAHRRSERRPLRVPGHGEPPRQDPPPIADARLGISPQSRVLPGWALHRLRLHQGRREQDLSHQRRRRERARARRLIRCGRLTGVDARRSLPALSERPVCQMGPICPADAGWAACRPGGGGQVQPRRSDLSSGT